MKPSWVVSILFVPLVFCGSTTAEEAHPAKGRLCIVRHGTQVDPATNACIDASDVSELDQAASDREFVWFPAGASEIALGMIAAGESGCRVSSLLRVPLTVTGSDFDQWPTRTEFQVVSADKKRTWRFVGGARAIDQLKMLRMPKGAYELTVTAPHHRPAIRRIAPDQGAEEFRIGRLTMFRLPVISGTVIDAQTNGGLAAAEVLLPSEKVLARSDGTGRFRGEIVDEWPEYLRITSPGRGTKVVKLPRSQADTTLEYIVMRKAGALTIVVMPALHGLIDIDRVENDEYHVVTTKTFTDTSPTTVDDLDAGEYVLIVRGDHPLEQHASFTRVEAGSTTQASITIDPVALHVALRSHNEPVRGARLEFVKTAPNWRGLVADSAKSGNLDAELWQQGEFTVFVTLPERGGYVAHKDLTGADPINWQIDLPTHRIAGKVVDAKTSSGLGDVQVFLETKTPKGSSLVWTRSGADGEFEFPFVLDGHAELSASAPGYLERRDSFELASGDEDHSSTLALERAHPVVVTVTTGDGVPVVDAVVVDASGDERAPLKTDDTGTVTIPLSEGERKTVYVVPKEGSFAIGEVAADIGKSAIVVAPGNAAIRVEATGDLDGAAIPNVGILFRYNGALIPPRVAGVIANDQGFQLHTGGDGTLLMPRMPSGVYEFFPVFSPAEAQRVVRGMAEAKAQLAARPGENVVSMTFRKKY